MHVHSYRERKPQRQTRSTRMGLSESLCDSSSTVVVLARARAFGIRAARWDGRGQGAEQTGCSFALHSCCGHDDLWPIRFRQTYLQRMSSGDGAVAQYDIPIPPLFSNYVSKRLNNMQFVSTLLHLNALTITDDMTRTGPSAIYTHMNMLCVDFFPFGMLYLFSSCFVG